MLRIHLLLHWFNLADNAVEEALYDIASLRRFVGIDLGVERVPDETTVLKFRHPLDKHDLGKKLFAEVGQVLQASGLSVKTGTIVDATLIGALSSTKNADKASDPELHQTRNGQQWYFGMKLHIGVDSQSGLVHSSVVTAANVHDKHPLPDLLHGNERRVYGDSAHASQKDLIQGKAPNALDFTNERTRKAGCEVDEVKKAKNRNKSKIRARVEHVFAVVKPAAVVGLRQGSLPRAGQERHACVHYAGDGQHLPRARTTVATSPCVASHEWANDPQSTKNRSRRFENRPKFEQLPEKSMKFRSPQNHRHCSS